MDIRSHWLSMRFGLYGQFCDLSIRPCVSRKRHTNSGDFLAMGVVLAGFYFLIRKPKPDKESVQAITSLERG